MQARVFWMIFAASLAVGLAGRAESGQAETGKATQPNLPPELLAAPSLIGTLPTNDKPGGKAAPPAHAGAPPDFLNARPDSVGAPLSATANPPPGMTPDAPPVQASAPAVDGQNQVHFSATYGAAQNFPIRAGLTWRIFDARADSDGGHALIAQSNEASPNFSLPDGDYVAHVACGLAGTAKPFSLHHAPLSDRLTLNAGALTVEGRLADAPLPPARLNLTLFLPQNDDPEAKLIVANLKAGAPQCLPEGNYHIVSRLLDQTPGATAPTNVTVTADVRVQAGKMTAAILRHRAANMTLKLVNAPGGEALANTSFSILTPGGDVIREMIGAFPSILLAEGEYVAIARHDNQTFQANFKVAAGQDRDVEILAHPTP